MTIKNRAELERLLKEETWRSNYDIARRLSVDERTVRNYRHSLEATDVIERSEARLVKRGDSVCYMNVQKIGSGARIRPSNEVLFPQLFDSQRDKPGQVYVIEGNGLFKIGMTSNFKNRLHTFSVKLPFAIEPTLLIQCRDASSIERQLHAIFAAKHMEGEWFRLEAEDLREIERLVSTCNTCSLLEMA